MGREMSPRGDRDAKRPTVPPLPVGTANSSARTADLSVPSADGGALFARPQMEAITAGGKFLGEHLAEPPSSSRRV